MKSNQQNLGTIKCSNLCTEIVEYSSADEVAVCNLASIALPQFVKKDGTFDFQKLREVKRESEREKWRMMNDILSDCRSCYSQSKQDHRC